MLIDKTQDIDGMISSHGRNFLVHAQAYETYKEFVSRLENLRRILDRPEAYF